MHIQTSQKAELFGRTLRLGFLGVFAVCAWAIFITCISPLKTDAATSSTVNFQARLENLSGNIASDGTYNVEFKLYNTSSSSGSSQGSCTGDASCLWYEDYLVSASHGVQVVNGYLTVNLGTYNSFPTNMNWNQQLWLTMRIGGTGSTPSWDIEMNPRLLLTATPYSFQAGQLSETIGSNTETLTLPSTLSSSITITVPNDGSSYNTVCLNNDPNCGFLTSSAANSAYVELQGSTPGTAQTGYFNISGTGIASILQASTFDTASNTTLNIGTTNASGINLNQNTSIAANKTLTVQGGATFQDATTSTTALQILQATTNAVLLTADTTNMRLGVDVTYAAMTSPTISAHSSANSGGTLSYNTTYYYEITAVDATGGETTPSAQVTQATAASPATNTYTITLTWAPITGAAAYHIYRSTTSGTYTGVGYYSTLGTVSGSNLTFTDTNATKNNTTASPPGSTNAYTATNVSNNSLQLSIGGNGTPTGQLYVGGTLPTAIGSAATQTSGTSESVYVSGRYAYVSGAYDLLQIVDVSNPASPTLISSVAGSGQSVYVSGHYAYIVNGSSSLYIYDISNPFSPVLLSATTTGTTPWAIYVQGRYAYITNESSYTMQIFDVSNPIKPVLISTTNTAGHQPESIYVQGLYAYVASNLSSGTVQIFNVSNPVTPSLVGSFSLDPQFVYVSGRYAYVVSVNSNTFQIYDISNPASPVSISSVSDSASPYSVYVQGRYAYVTNSSNTLQVFDISNPANPISIGSVGSGSGSYQDNVYVSGRYAYIANGSAGALQVFDLGGAYIQQLQAGGTETGTLQVDNNASIFGDESIQGGLSTGASVQDAGNLAVAGAANFGSVVTVTGGPVSTPSAPTVTSTGGSSTGYSYEIAAINGSDQTTAASGPGSTASGAATLTTSAYNTITWTAVTGAYGYNIYRTASSGAPSSLGLIGTTQSTSFIDIGYAANTSFTAPATNSITTAFQVQNAAGNSVLAVNTTGNQVVLGTTGGSGVNGQLVFNSATAGNYAITLNASSSTSASYTMTLPTSEASTGQCLQAGTVSGVNVPLVFGSCVDNNASITEVNEWDNHGTSSAITTLGDSPVNAGDLLVLTVQLPGTSVSVATVSGGGVTSAGWTKVKTNSGDGTVDEVEMWMGKVATNGTGAGTITLTYNGTVGATNEITTTEFTANGVSINTAWGVDTSGVLLNSSSNTVTYPSLTSAGPSELYVGYAQTKNPGSIGSSTGFSYIPTQQSNIIAYTSPTLAGNPYQPTASEGTAGESNTVAALITAFVSSTAINNSTTLQQANFDVQAASSGSIAGALQAASGGTADILDLRNSGGTNVATFGNTGNVLLQASTNSTTAFQIQNNTGTAALLTADTTNMRLGVDVTYAAMTSPTISAHSSANSGGTLSYNTTYYYEITAVDATGGETTPSAQVTQATAASPATNTYTITLTWAPITGAAAYHIYRSTTSGTYTGVGYYSTLGTVSGSNLTFTDTNATKNNTTASPPGSTNAYTATNVSNNSLQLSIGGNGTPTGQLYVSGMQPQVVGYAAAVGAANSVYVQGNYAYMAVTTAGNAGYLQIYDISDPANPTLISTTAANNNYANGVYVAGRYAYLAVNGTYNLQVYDISNPTLPILMGSVADSDWNTTIYAQGRYAYEVGYNGLHIYDVSNPANPILLSTTGVGGTGVGVYVQGNYAYVTDGGTTTPVMDIIDISNPSNPVIVGSVATSGSTNGVYVSGRYAYVADNGSSPNCNLHIYDVSNPASPTSVNCLTNIGWTVSVYVQGRYAYTMSNNELTVFDISNPINPVLVTQSSWSTTSDTANDLYVQGRYAYVASAGTNQLVVLDLGGTYTQQLQAGGTETGTLQVDTNETIGGSSAIQGGLSIGATLQAAGNATLGGLTITGLATPAAPSVSNNCATSCTYTWGYEVAAFDASGSSPASTVGTTTTSAQTLTSSVYNTVTWTAVSGAVGYNIYRSSVPSGGSPATTGYIGTVYASAASLSFLDKAIAATGSIPTSNTAGSFVADGTTLLQDATNSTSAFQIQNSSGSTVLYADTTNMQVVIGSTTNGIVLSATNGLVAYGTAQHTKKIILTAEYAGAVLDNGGASSDIGTMIAGYDSTQKENYYQWTTAQSTNQTYDIVIQIPIPSDFSSWAVTNPLTVDINVSSTTNGAVIGTLLDTANAAVTNWNTCTLTPTATGWVTSGAGGTNAPTACAISSGTWTAGGVATLRLHLQAPPSGTTEVGDIVMSYKSSF